MPILFALFVGLFLGVWSCRQRWHYNRISLYLHLIGIQGRIIVGGAKETLVSPRGGL